MTSGFVKTGPEPEFLFMNRNWNLVSASIYVCMWNRIRNQDVNVFERKKKKKGVTRTGINWNLTSDSNLG
jgi:hypothetical protein